MNCKKCGENLSQEDKNCPNCGEFVPQQVYILNIVGLVVAILSVLYNPFGFTSLAAIVISIIGLRKIKGTRYLGKGLAIAGIVIGVITLLWLIAVLILDNFVFVSNLNKVR